MRRTARLARRPIAEKYHGMEWGDDPRRYLERPVPGYWRELRRDGMPMKEEGEQQILDEPDVKHATQVVKDRFDDKQADKLRGRGPGGK